MKKLVFLLIGFMFISTSMHSVVPDDDVGDKVEMTVDIDQSFEAVSLVADFQVQASPYLNYQFTDIQTNFYAVYPLAVLLKQIEEYALLSLNESEQRELLLIDPGWQYNSKAHILNILFTSSGGMAGRC